ncbi:hypothetical protein [Streptomyces sp. NPDC014656]|uniref:hypothetical protein n=1 Tax=Streptomyces sp. NPDC014656 TaxID=3364878 RepID=UPI0036FCD43C
MILLSDPTLPGRLAHLLSDGPNPAPGLRDVARRLEAAGSEVIAVPSVTSQAHHTEVAAAVEVSVVDLLTAVSHRLHAAGVRRPALAVTDGTRRTGLLHRARPPTGCAPHLPTHRPSAASRAASTSSNHTERRRHEHSRPASPTSRGPRKGSPCSSAAPTCPPASRASAGRPRRRRPLRPRGTGPGIRRGHPNRAARHPLTPTEDLQRGHRSSDGRGRTAGGAFGQWPEDSDAQPPCQKPTLIIHPAPLDLPRAHTRAWSGSRC